MKIVLVNTCLILSIFSLSSCSEPEEKSRLDKLRDEERFFSNSASVSLKEFKNESANFPTHYLKLFKDDPIAWQAWDQSLEEKAHNCQTPILAFVVSAVNGNCRKSAEFIYQNEEALNLLRDNNLCTLVDIHANPEMGLFSQQLASESGNPISFPALIWLSHEKLPIASFSAGMMNEKQLIGAIKNSASMVKYIWGNSSDYAVTNSRESNNIRQKNIDARLKFKLPKTPEDNDNFTTSLPSTRNDLYRSATRKVISYYDPISENFDGLGGILPSSTLELSGIASLSHRFTPQIRSTASDAFTKTARNLIFSATNDPLTDDFFQSKRGPNWALPVFSKRLETQAQLASALLRSGHATKHQLSITEGLILADRLIAQISTGPPAIEIPLKDPDLSGHFLWKKDDLSDHLNPEELKIFSKVYAIKKYGNIPATVDPTGKYFRLNSLGQARPWDELASEFNLSEDELKAKLSPLHAKLLANRIEDADLFQEPLVSANQISAIVNVMHAAWAISGKQKYLTTALKLGNQLRSEYHAGQSSMTRFPDPTPILARGEDFAGSALAFLDLYQATLDPKWHRAAQDTIEQSLSLLTRGDFPLMECQANDLIIPTYLHNTSMIFGDSSTGRFDQAFTRLLAIQADERFSSRRDWNTEHFQIHLEQNPIIHTDLLRSFALGNSPYLITVSGNPSSPERTHALQKLNQSNIISFATIASADLPSLRTLSPSSSESSPINFYLYRENTLLAEATDIKTFTQLFEAQMAKKE